jgi:Ca2+-binding EF-hand superfamily protein
VLIRQLLDFEGIPQEIIRAFNLFDKDGNGRISAYEVRQALHHFGIQVSDFQVGAHCRSVSLRVPQCR